MSDQNEASSAVTAGTVEEEQSSCGTKTSTQLPNECRKRPLAADRVDVPTTSKKRPYKQPPVPIGQRAKAPPPVYYFENGLRKVRPYWQEFSMYVKGRWLGRQLQEVLTTEFNRLQREQYVEAALKLGRIKVNNEKVSPDYVLKNNDLIWHRHERPVGQADIVVLQETDEVLVVDKPCSVPVHPCGAYNHNSVTSILQFQHGITGLRLVHRLDRTTSGCLILAKTLAADQKFSKLFRDRGIEKEYLARVDGVFPELVVPPVECFIANLYDDCREKVTVDQPINALIPAMGIQIVEKSGKETLTKFERVWTDGHKSVVRCLPETGRTHQIRVHLQYLGYPIDNDYIYNDDAFGPAKGKDCDYGGMSRDELHVAIAKRHSYTTWLVRGEMNEPPFEIRNFAAEGGGQTDTAEREDYDPCCVDCHVDKFEPSDAQLFMHLHCLKYCTDTWSFESPTPEWAKQPNVISESTP